MTTTIGDLTTARMLYNHFGGINAGPGAVRRSPSGFRKLGTGCFRMAVLDKSTQVVYKFGSHDINLSESTNAQALRRRSFSKLGFELVIPHTRTWRMPKAAITRGWRKGMLINQNVIAQEFAGKSRFTYCNAQEDWLDNPRCTCRNSICFKEVHEALYDATGLVDIHGGNILQDTQGRFWFIDLSA